MTRLAEKIALNLDGVHILNSGQTIDVITADCDRFHGITAVGGDILIASFLEAEITGDQTDITLNSGNTLLVSCKSVTLGTSTGKAVITKINF